MAQTILTSLRGKRLGLTANGDLVVDKGDGSQSVLSPSVTAGTTLANLPNYGVSTLSTALVGYTLDDPTPGTRKTIIAQLPTTATGRFVQTSTAAGVTFGSTGAFNKWASTASHTLDLIGLSTSAWQIVSNVGASSLSTTVGALSTI